jgi:hypothetical protein
VRGVSVELQELSWREVALWIIATAAGWGFGFIPVMLLITGALATESDYQPNMMARIVLVGSMCGISGLMSAAVVGGGQAWVLRKYGEDRTDLWFQASTLGGVIGWSVGWVAAIIPLGIGSFSKVETWIMTGAVLGSIIGGMTGSTQLPVLRRWVPNNAYWVPVSVVAWLAGMVTYWIVYSAAGGPFGTVVTSYYEDGVSPKTVEAPGFAPAMLAGWVVGGLVLGAITGVTLKLLVGRATLEESAAP